MFIITFFLTLGILLLLLQTTMFQILPEWLGKPALLFTLIVFLAIRVNTLQGVILVLLLGMIMDVFSGIFLGLYPVIYLLLFFLIKQASRHLAIEEPIYQPPLLVISYLLASSLVFILTFLLAPENRVDWSWSYTLLQILILSIISIPLFTLYNNVLSICNRKNKLSFFKRRTGNRFIDDQ